MGTEFYLLDLTNRQALDVGKFTALGRIAGFTGTTVKNVLPVTRGQVIEAARGWPFRSVTRPEEGEKMLDVGFSTMLSQRVTAWLETHSHPVAELRLARGWYPDSESIYEGPGPWDGDWTLWTLYTHPVHRGPVEPGHGLFTGRLEDKIGDAKVVFGLEAQGHLPTIQRMLDEGSSWDAIGRAINWDPATAKKHWELHRG